MVTAEFTPKDIPALRRAAKFLRRTELNLPDTADSKTHDAILISALRLDDQADELDGQAPDPTVKGARRPIFNQLVAPEAGGPMFHEEANALLDAHEDTVRAAAAVGALRLQGAMLALHPKTANPRHGCCATPKVCKGTHRPECRSSEHTIGGQVPWPCKSLRAVGIRTDADADAVRQALAKLERDAGRDGYPSRKKANRGYAVHATRQMDGGIGDTGACGTYFPQDTESSLEAPGTDVSCQACVKALLSKREEAEAGATAEATHRCTLPSNRFLPCDCCPHQVCEDCGDCAHTCECGTGGTPAQPAGAAGELCPNGQPRPECSESDPCEPC
ncbi:hypothetical protein [Streptomyces mirabilis]|uniref:hypothetical protein n=1 Tax=Streptomyces mirabilis TaxID=68239 RepID=UPI0021C15FEE|nr:hypothetical protein [Streptomyces mirabilis]MCT9105362.1 hypothetical protein [Streptomyces mirabilis]